MGNFEPKIVAFLCNWCAYAGADLAGVSRLQYPPNIRTIRVMCSGRVDPLIYAWKHLRRAVTAFWWPGDISVIAITWKVMFRPKRRFD